MTEKKKDDPRPKWSSKKYKNYGEFNKAVLDWRERNNKGYKWNKKDVVWETRNGKRVAIDKNTGRVLKFQERGIPGFVQDHINPKVIEFSRKPFGFDYANLRGSKIYDEEKRRFLTIGELKKRNKLREESREEKEDFEWGPGGQPSASQQIAMQGKIDKFADFEEKGAHEWGGGEQPSASEQLRIAQGDPSAAELGEDEAEAFEWGEEGQPDASIQMQLAGDGSNWSSDVTDSGSNKSRTNRTRSSDNIGPSTGRAAMRAQNVERFGEAHVAHLEAKNTAFQAMKRGDITKEKFINDFPQSNLAKATRKRKLKIKKK